MSLIETGRPRLPHPIAHADPIGGAEQRLRARLGDRVRRDPGTRALYASDASLFRTIPGLVVEPLDIDELAFVTATCGEAGVPLTVRGAGTSIAGNALGSGVLVLTRSLDRIVELDPEAGYAVVEPGVVLDDLNVAASQHGLRFGPDPSTHSRCTIGGMVGNNACGSHSVAWGTTAQNVLGLDVVSPDGTRARLGSPRAPDRPGDAGWPSIPPLMTERLESFSIANEAIIRRELPEWPRRVSGYALDWLLPERGFDVAKALTGTEGTCVVLARATVRLVRPPSSRGLLVLGFSDDIEGATSVPALLSAEPFTVESLSAELLALAHATPETVGLPAGGAWLLVEARADDAAGAWEHAKRLGGSIGRSLDGADVRFIQDPATQAALWQIREDGAGHSARMADGTKAWPGFEDSAVPPARLGDYLKALRGLLSEQGLQAISYGHYGEGCVHLRVGFGLSEVGGAVRYERFMEAAADLVVAHGGSLSGEHGDGRSRGPLLEKQFSPEMRSAFAEFKAIWDPTGILNPGIIVDPPALTTGLRAIEPQLLQVSPKLAFDGDGGEFRSAVERCIGIGRCVSTQGSALMCPSFRVTRDEEHSTRGRARLLQEMVSGSLANDGWRSTEVRDALDLCLSCRGCATECPTGVDMAAYKAEFLDHHYRRRLRPLSHYSLGWLPLWLKMTARVPRLVNAVTGSRLTRWAFAATAGIARERGIPPVARRAFTRDWKPRPIRTDTLNDSVVLWPDTFNNRLTPRVAHDAVRVLGAAGFDTIVPRRTVCCGLTWHTTGQLGTARRVLERSLGAPELAGVEPVVVLEPSCATMLRKDLPELLPDDPRARSLADRVVTLAELLDKVDYVGPSATSTDARGAISQPHCHQQSVLGLHADRRVMERNGISVANELSGCCGLAGNFGAEPGHQGIARAVAELALVPALDADPEAPTLADGFSCRTQVRQAGHGSPRHLAELVDDSLR